MMTYLIRYTVAAVSRLDAITKATGMVRTGVRVNGVSRCDEVAPGTWEVALHVWEDQ